MQTITNYGVTYIWSNNTKETCFVCATHLDECGDLEIPIYLKDALERYAKELEQAERSMS
jgi:hypothetical protein